MQGLLWGEAPPRPPSPTWLSAWLRKPLLGFIRFKKKKSFNLLKKILKMPV